MSKDINMTNLEKLAIYCLHESGQYSLGEIANFLGLPQETAAMYTSPSPFKWGSYLKQKEIRIIQTLIEDEISNVKVAHSLTEDEMRLTHLSRILKNLKTLKNKFSKELLIFKTSNVTDVTNEYTLKH